MYWNGQMIRFFVNEIKDVFSEMFKMDRDDNKGYFDGEDFKERLVSMKGKLIDKQFDIFYKAATCH